MGRLLKIYSIIFGIVLVVVVYGYNVFVDKMNYVNEQSKQFENIGSNIWYTPYKDMKEVSGSDVKTMMTVAESKNVKILVKTLANKQGVEYSKDKRYTINNINDDNHINEIAMFTNIPEKDKQGKIIKVILEQKKE